MEGISIIIPNYNKEKYIEKCVNSVLEQGYMPKEIIIVDDCSTDNTRTILRRYANEGKIILLENDTNNGAAQSRNNCLAVATKEYVAVQDADDYCTKERFERQVAVLEKNPSFDLYQPGYRNSMRQGKR